jgi:glycosyltransferase involved in cell wall biosynthesis
MGGGAEVYTFEIAKGLARAGASVTIYTAMFKDGKTDETVEGIRHIRRGSELTVHFYGFLHALFNARKYDLIIDEYNGLGFMGFLLPRSMMLIHQMYREFWMKELGTPGYIPYFIEPLLLRCYRNVPAITVSPSTRDDLLALGVRKVKIVMNALGNAPLPEVPEKGSVPTMLFLGRLRSTKRPADAIEIYKKVKEQVPDVRLVIVGRGPQELELKTMAVGDPDITFMGFVSEEEKFRILSRAHLMLVPSVREGFGINVIEAASQGTPSVGYNVHGLRDSIRDGDTGLLATGPDDAAEKAVSLLKDLERLSRMSFRCLEYAREFNWDRRSEEFLKALQDLTGKKP